MILTIWFSIIIIISIIVIITDIWHLWIPDEAIFVLTILFGAASFYGFTYPDIFASIGVISFFLFLYVCYPNGLGSGDVKLAAALSLGCSPPAAFFMIAIAFLLAFPIAIFFLIIKKNVLIPFGPFLLIGWWCAYFWSDKLLGWLF